MENNYMIITPNELQKWVKDGRSFQVVDIRTEDQRNEFPLSVLKSVVGSAETLPSPNAQPMILVCQFGVVTEGIILEQELENAYSLLGGVLAWEALQTHKDDLSRWSRQTALPEFGIRGQKKLNGSRIAVVGIGGLGCHAASMLAAAGVGSLQLIDGDRIELSNLHRQPLYGLEDIGSRKVNAAASRLSSQYDRVIINTVPEMLVRKNLKECLNGADVIIDATDTIRARILIDRASRELGIPMVYGGLYRFEGQVAVLNHHGSPGYRDLFPEPPASGDACAEAGILGMLPGIIGNIQALEAVKLIAGIEPTLAGRLLIYDGLSHNTTIMDISAKE
ncbi:MAG: ThiF family adenylyltransferase [Candidatus Neomarinimicrobiota bacterium]|nr:ThiF family adenylyltransferase [Candidatus Neomarinimicrobiota bacterium]